MCVCVLGMTDQVLSNDARWQNALFTSAATIRKLLEVLLGELLRKQGDKEWRY
jgi:hypothetical protein